MRLRVALFSTENQSYRGILSCLHPMLSGVVQVEVHLPCIGVAESTDLEINHDQATKTAMKEKQVDPEPRFVDSKSLLSSDESEVIPEFKQEVGQMFDQGFFENSKTNGSLIASSGAT